MLSINLLSAQCRTQPATAVPALLLWTRAASGPACLGQTGQRPAASPRRVACIIGTGPLTWGSKGGQLAGAARCGRYRGGTAAGLRLPEWKRARAVELGETNQLAGELASYLARPSSRT